MNAIDLPELLPPIPLRDARAEELLTYVGKAFSLPVEEILGKSRLLRISEARLVSYWLLRTRTRMSFPEIGRAMRKDHSTVMYGVQKCVRRRATDRAFADFTDKLAEAVEARMREGV